MPLCNTRGLVHDLVLVWGSLTLAKNWGDKGPSPPVPIGVNQGRLARVSDRGRLAVGTN